MLLPKAAFAFVCSLLICAGALAQSAHTPQPGSAERAAIMDAIRVPAQKELKQTVIFNVDRLRVAGNWAYAKVSPTKPDGSTLDYSKTKFQKQIEFGAFDPQGEALLFKESSGSWSVLEWTFGSTDVPSAGWSSKHGAMPKTLLQ